MICTTVRKGYDCPFMTAKGCSYNGGSCLEAVEACKGCSKILEIETGWYCSAFPEPALKWKNGVCNMATPRKGGRGIRSGKGEPVESLQARPTRKINIAFISLHALPAFRAGLFFMACRSVFLLDIFLLNHYTTCLFAEVSLIGKRLLIHPATRCLRASRLL